MPPRAKHPRHQPRPPAAAVNPAAAALGVGINPDTWTTEGIIHAMTNRYLQLIQLSEEEKNQENFRKQRLYQAGAMEWAQMIAAYYQHKGETEAFERWVRRTRQAGSIAYRRDNPVAVSIGVEMPASARTEGRDV